MSSSSIDLSPRVYFLVSSRDMQRTTRARKSRAQGPLAGPDRFPEPKLLDNPGYGPGHGGDQRPTGYFLDRYVY